MQRVLFNIIILIIIFVTPWWSAALLLVVGSLAYERFFEWFFWSLVIISTAALSPRLWFIWAGLSIIFFYATSAAGKWLRPTKVRSTDHPVGITPIRF